MDETVKTILTYYQKIGTDQTTLTSMLREVQEETGGAIPPMLLPEIAEAMGVKESYLQALIGRLPSLRLAQGHVLELCAGPNCGKHTTLAAKAETLCRQAGMTLRFMPCMRLCGKGPNLKFDGKLYHKADEALLKKLLGL